MLAQGDAQKRRSSTFTATLTDWLQLSDGQLGPAAQEDGDPTVGTASNDRFRNQATVETREALTFSIASTIVDILPNGNLVLEARKSIRANDNVWETSLTGVCRPIDVGPDNVVLSKVMMNLEIHKEDQGQLRDGYKRGWLSRWIDRLNPF
jgi:flagellar L-ring protein precursor FlgH